MLQRLRIVSEPIWFAHMEKLQDGGNIWSGIWGWVEFWIGGNIEQRHNKPMIIAGPELSLSKFICWIPNAQYLRMWRYLK